MPDGKRLKPKMTRPRVINEAIAYLRSQLMAVVSTVGTDGKPQAATVFFWVDDVARNRFNIYFVTRRHSRKFANLLINHSVAVVVGSAFEPHTLQIEGEAELIAAGDGIRNMARLSKLLAKKPNMSMLYSGAFFPKNPFGKIIGEDFAVFQVKASWARFMTYDKESKELAYHQIIG